MHSLSSNTKPDLLRNSLPAMIPGNLVLSWIYDKNTTGRLDRSARYLPAAQIPWKTVLLQHLLGGSTAGRSGGHDGDRLQLVCKGAGPLYFPDPGLCPAGAVCFSIYRRTDLFQDGASHRPDDSLWGQRHSASACQSLFDRCRLPWGFGAAPFGR